MQTTLSGPAALCLLLLMGCGARAPARAADPVAANPVASGCLPGGGGYLRATLRGAVNADIDWLDAQMSCEGDARPGGRGLRITIAGPLPAADRGAARRLRFVFGIDAHGPGAADQALPTNLTAIIEGEQQVFATQGEDKCTTDRLRRGAVDAAGPRRQRIEAHGFCTGPASALDGSGRLLVSTFDFAAGMSAEEPK